MSTPNASDAKNLISLAERMGIPADEAARQVRQLIGEPEQDGPTAPSPACPPENANLRLTV